MRVGGGRRPPRDGAGPAAPRIAGDRLGRRCPGPRHRRCLVRTRRCRYRRDRRCRGPIRRGRRAALAARPAGRRHDAPTSSATAKHATPSDRPSAPRPSARLPLTVTGAPTAAGQALADGVSPRRQLRRLEHDRAVDVLGRPPGGPHVGDRPAQQADRVGARQRGVGVGEVLADVAQAGRAEQGVGDRVGDDVGVAVARPGPARRGTRPRRARGGRAGSSENGWTSKPCPTRSAGSARRAGSVTPAGSTVASAGTEQRLGHHQVGGAGDLQVVGRAGHDDHLATIGLDQRRIVGGLRAGTCAARRAAARNACGVCTATSPSRSTGVPSWARSVSFTGAPGRAASAPDRTASTTAANRPAAGEGTGGVVHHDHVGRRRHGRQAGAHRAGTGGSAGHDRIGGRLDVAGVVLGDDEDDAVGDGAGRVQRPVERPAARPAAGTASRPRSGARIRPRRRSPTRLSWCGRRLPPTAPTPGFGPSVGTAGRRIVIVPV